MAVAIMASFASIFYPTAGASPHGEITLSHKCGRGSGSRSEKCNMLSCRMLCLLMATNRIPNARNDASLSGDLGALVSMLSVVAANVVDRLASLFHMTVKALA